MMICGKLANFFADNKEINLITSTSNAQVKNVISLIKKSGERKSRGLFVIEGLRMFVETPKELIDKLYVSQSFLGNKSNFEKIKEYEYEVVADNVFSHMSDTKTPQGILATVKMVEHSLDVILEKDKNPLLVVLENLQDPGNLGTIVRTSEGAGVTGIIMTKDTVDIYNPKVIRSTMGALFRMPFVYVDSLKDALTILTKKGIKSYAACLEGAVCYTECDYKLGSAIIIGNEGNGLTRETIELADSRIKIPMGGQLESLNAAVSTAIIAYEAARQRREI